MSEILKNKVALVTGATRGIGRAIVDAYMAQGAQVVGMHHSSHDIAKTMEAESNGQFWPLAANLADHQDFDSLLADLPTKFSPIDILVNNAGIKLRTAFLDSTPQIWEETMAVNLRAPYFLAQAVAPGMMDRKWGRINITSQATEYCGPSSIEYGMTKSGLVHVTKALARLLAPHNITVNAISPGRTYTDMTGYETNPQKEQEALATIPLGRINQPSDVADTALFLASESGRNITAQTISIDGGTVIHG